MLEQISQLVRQYGQDAVVNNPDVPNSENNAVLTEATNTITGGLQNMLSGGGLRDIISMFAGSEAGSSRQQRAGGIGGLLKNPIVMMMVGHLISKLVGKFKMNHAQAGNIANNLVPNVLNGLVNRTASKDPADDAFDFNDLIGSLTGGNAAGAGSGPGAVNFQDLLEQFRGSGDGNGGFDLQDIVTQVTRGAQQSQEQQSKSGSGIVDLVRGFFN